MRSLFAHDFPTHFPTRSAASSPLIKGGSKWTKKCHKIENKSGPFLPLDPILDKINHSSVFQFDDTFLVSWLNLLFTQVAVFLTRVSWIMREVPPLSLYNMSHKIKPAAQSISFQVTQRQAGKVKSLLLPPPPCSFCCPLRCSQARSTDLQ